MPEQLNKVEIEAGIPTTSVLLRNQEALAAKINEIVDHINNKVVGS